MSRNDTPTVTAYLIQAAQRYQIKRPSDTWLAIEASLSRVPHKGTRRHGYTIKLGKLGKLGRVKIGGYGHDLLVTFYPKQPDDGICHPLDIVQAHIDSLNQIISRGIGYHLTVDQPLDHVVLSYVADYADAAVYQSIQQLQQHSIINGAPVACNLRRASIQFKHDRPSDRRRHSSVTMLPHDRKQPTQLRINIDIRQDLLTSVRNKSRSARWTLAALCTQHQQLHQHAIAPMLERLGRYRPSRCVLAPASWPPACKRAFATWIAGKPVRCDPVTWRRMAAYDIDLSSPPSTREIDVFAVRLLTAADLRAASAPCALRLRVAKPDDDDKLEPFYGM